MIKTWEKTPSKRGQTSKNNDSYTLSTVFEEAQGFQKCSKMEARMESLGTENPSTLGRTLSQNSFRGDRVYPIPPTPLPLHDPPPAIWLKTRKNTCKMQKDAFCPHQLAAPPPWRGHSGSFGTFSSCFYGASCMVTSKTRMFLLL